MIILLALIFAAFASKKEIKSFPGYKGELPFKVWSGHLNVPGTDRFYYYIFTECYDPTTDNLILWQQGGPGGSSLYAFIVENGIFKLQPDGETLLLNEWSWNKLGHTVWIESPAGVGFSYDASGQRVQWDDDKYADDMHQVLLELMKEFPEMQKKQLILTGESYAGRYLPILAMHIHDTNVETVLKDERLNLQGMVIGNGCLSQHDDHNSKLMFLLQHQIIKPEEFSHVMEVCKGDPYANESDPECENAYRHAVDAIHRAHLNIYYLYDECVPDMQFRSVEEERAYFERYTLPDYKVDPKWGKNEDHSICTGRKAIEHYFNKPEVQTAIHVNSTKWGMYGDIDYHRSNYESMAPFLEILKEFYAIQLYNGDCDACVNGAGTQISLAGMGMKIVNEWRPWFLDELDAGFVENYEDDFTFVTIRGAGHMAPQIKPKRSFMMLKGYFDGNCC